MTIHAGSCHCGRIRFEVSVEGIPTLYDCNCSICRRVGYLHLIVEATEFRIVAGNEELTEYRFGSRVARHTFCRHCGIKPFYVPRSHPSGMSVNARCLEPAVIAHWPVERFDGDQWEAAHAARFGSDASST